MNKTWDVALIGDSFIDHVLGGFKHWPQPGQESFAETYLREAGGGAVTTACALGRLGRNATLVTAVGREDGHWLLRRVHEYDVDTSAVERSDLLTGMTAAVSFPSDRAFFTYRGANVEVERMFRDHGVIEQLVEARHVHIAFEPEHKTAMAVFEKLRAAGCTISLDMGWHEGWLRDPKSLELIRLATVFLPNEMEARAISGQDDPHAMCEFFDRCGVPSVAIKLGEKGAVMGQAGAFYTNPGLKVDAVDTTGAGDAFDAGFIHALLGEASPDRCLAVACACGALSTREPGALHALPSAEELESRL